MSSLQQHLTYRLASLQRDLRKSGFPEKFLSPDHDLLTQLSQYYILKALEEQGEDKISFEEESFGQTPTILRIEFTFPEGRLLPEKELARRLEYLEMDRSRPEIIIRQTLEEIFPGVTFPSVRPNFLRYPETGQNLEFDVYNETLHLAVEYNGIQHYEVTKPFHKSKDDLIAQQKRDAFKAVKANELGIDLLVIPYTVNDEDIPEMVRAWVSQLGRSPEEIAEAQRVSRCQEEKLSPQDVIALWSIVPDNVSSTTLEELSGRVEQCFASPDEIITYEKIRWQQWLGSEATPENYLRLRPYLEAALRTVAWPENTNQEAYLLRQVLELIKVAPGDKETINSRDLLTLEDELMALYPSLVHFFPNLDPIQDIRYFKGWGGRLMQRVVTDPNKKSYKAVVRFLDSLIGEYFGYHLEIVKEKRIQGKRNYLLQWQPNDELLPLLVERIRG